MTSQPQHVIFGAGILGLTIAAELAAMGASVRLVTRKGTSHLPGVTAAKADLADPDSAIQAARGADVLYFCAAPPYQDWTRSFYPLQNAAIAAARHSGAVLVSAENLYGYGVAGTLHESLPLMAMTQKGAARAQMSKRLFQAHEGGEIRAVSGRASDFFGPKVHTSALGERFWPDLIKGRLLNWFGDPDTRHSFTYLPDFARALITLGGTPDAFGRAWHVPSPKPLTVREVARRAARMIGAPEPRLRRTPRLLLRLVGIMQPAAGEMVEMEYTFVSDFVMSHADWDRRFKTVATGWEPALRATLDAWVDEMKAKASAA